MDVTCDSCVVVCRLVADEGGCSLFVVWLAVEFLAAAEFHLHSARAYTVPGVQETAAQFAATLARLTTLTKVYNGLAWLTVHSGEVYHLEGAHLAVCSTLGNLASGILWESAAVFG